MAITAPTPMMIPSAVKPERILFLLNASRATLRVVKRVMRLGDMKPIFPARICANSFICAELSRTD